MPKPRPSTISSINHQVIKATFQETGIIATIQFQATITPEQALELMQTFKVPCSVSFTPLQFPLQETKE